jgi:hypothetical protein
MEKKTPTVLHITAMSTLTYEGGDIPSSGIRIIVAVSVAEYFFGWRICIFADRKHSVRPKNIYLTFTKLKL